MRLHRFALLLILIAVPSGGPASGAPPEPPKLPEAQQQAVAALKRVGGTVSRDASAPGQPVTGVTFYAPIRDDDVGVLGAFPALKWLVVCEGQITDAGLGRLTAIRTLEDLSIAHSPITDAGLAHLRAVPALRRLTIRDAPITDAGLTHLAQCPRLHVVEFRDTAVTDAGVNRLKEELPYALIANVRSGEAESAEHGEGAGPAWHILLPLGLGAAAAVWMSRSRWAPARCRPWLWKVPLAGGAILATGAVLLWAAPRVYPVREGHAARFWLHACGIDVGVRNPEPRRGYYLPRDGWFIYYVQGMHGRALYRVPAADAQALFPTVVDRLRKAPQNVLDPDVEAGFRAWLASGAEPGDAAGLLAKIHESRLARLKRENPPLYRYVLPQEDEFADRWRRINRFHWALWFEFAFFSAVILVAAWPWLRNAGPRQWGAHVALLLPLVCLPFWLGYAPLTFTSAGDKEVVLYPRLLIHLRGLPWSEVDTAILRALPKPLEPLSQTPGPMISLSGFGAPGPVAIAALGLSAGLAVVAVPKILRRREQILQRIAKSIR